MGFAFGAEDVEVVYCFGFYIGFQVSGLGFPIPQYTRSKIPKSIQSASTFASFFTQTMLSILDSGFKLLHTQSNKNAGGHGCWNPPNPQTFLNPQKPQS